MIVVTGPDGLVVYHNPDSLIVLPEEREAEVRAALKRPVVTQGSVALPDGGIGCFATITLRPGDPGHARAALLTLPGAEIVLEDDEEE